MAHLPQSVFPKDALIRHGDCHDSTAVGAWPYSHPHPSSTWHKEAASKSP